MLFVIFWQDVVQPSAETSTVVATPAVARIAKALEMTRRKRRLKRRKGKETEKKTERAVTKRIVTSFRL